MCKSSACQITTASFLTLITDKDTQMQRTLHRKTKRMSSNLDNFLALRHQRKVGRRILCLLFLHIRILLHDAYIRLSFSQTICQSPTLAVTTRYAYKNFWKLLIDLAPTTIFLWTLGASMWSHVPNLVMPSSMLFTIIMQRDKNKQTDTHIYKQTHKETGR